DPVLVFVLLDVAAVGPRQAFNNADIRQCVAGYDLPAPVAHVFGGLTAAGHVYNDSQLHLAPALVGADEHGRAQPAGMLADHGLEFRGEHTHPIDLEHFLAPAEVADKALFGDHAAVAGVQPAIAQRLGNGLGAVPVALEQGRGTYAQLALAA